MTVIGGIGIMLLPTIIAYVVDTVIAGVGVDRNLFDMPIPGTYEQYNGVE